MAKITVEGVEYTYAYTSANLNNIILKCSADKHVEAIDYCADLLATKLPDDEEHAFERAVVGQAIMAELSQRLAALKKSPAASAPASQ